MFRNRFNKYSATKTYSELWEMTFDSKAEATRADELFQLQKAKEIKDLEFQPIYYLCEHPSIKIKLDFKYKKGKETIIEDVKGFIERDFRVKCAWLKEKHGVDVRLLKRNHKRWDIINLSGKIVDGDN